MFKRQRYFSVFPKVLLVFLIVVLPMYFLSVYVTVKGQNSVRNEILKSAESKGDFYLSFLETQIYNVMTLQLNILNDSQVRMFKQSGWVMPLSEKLITLNYVRDMLRNTKNMNAYIDDIRVFIPNLDKEVTTQQVLPLNYQEYRHYLRFSSVENLPFCIIEDEYHINMVPEFYSKQVHETYDDEPLLVSIRICKDALEISMDDIVGMEGGGAFLVSDGRGLALYTDEENVQYQINNLVKDMSLTDKRLESMTIEGVKYHIFLSPSNFLHSILVMYVPESSFFAALKTFRTWVWFMSALALVLVAIFSLWIRGMIISPLGRLVDSLKQVEDGDIDIEVSYSKNDEFGHLYSQFNYLVKKLKDLISDVFKKELLLKDAEYKQLQFQINPHFLHNSLAVIYGLIKLKDTECALKMTQHLRHYYQYITKELTGDVTLEQEVNHIKDFSEIQNIRFQGRISSQIEDLPHDVRDFYVPKLILQPIVENAYKHGLKNKTGNGLLKVSFCEQGQYLKINIEDNGEELSDDILIKLKRSLQHVDNHEIIGGTGLRNVRERLRLKFGEESGLEVDRSAMGGLSVKLVIFMGG